MKIQTTTVNDRTYAYLGWRHANLASKVHLVEASNDGRVDGGAPTLCGLRFTDNPDDERSTQGRPCGNCNRKAGTGSTRTTGIDEIVRHVKTDQTGATVTVTRVGPGSTYEQEPGWMTMCLDHGQLVFHETRILATRHSSNPAGWCESCANLHSDILHGRAEKISGAKIR